MPRAAAMAAALLAAGCEEATEPGRLPDELSILVSDPLPQVEADSAAGPSAGPLDARLGRVDGVVFVSVAPGTAPDAVGASVVNLRTAESADPMVRDGGFDPLAIHGTPGDTIGVTFRLPDRSTQFARTVIPARRRPRVVRTSPSRGRTDVAINTTITIVFSEPIDPSSVNRTSVRLLRGAALVPGTIRHIPDSEVAVEFVPETLLAPDAEFHLILGSEISDLSGDALEVPELVVFTTIAGPLSPPGTEAPGTESPDTESPGTDLPTTELPPVAPPSTEPPSGTEAIARLVVRTTTNGPQSVLDLDGYSVLIDGAPAGHVASNDSITIEGLSWGVHTITLADIAAGCAVSLPPLPRQVLLSREMSSASASMTIVCEAPAVPIADPAPTLTGRITFVSMRDGNAEIYAVNPDGSGIQRLTDSPASDRDPAWSPDGSRIAFTSNRDGETHVYVMNADGSEVEKRTVTGAWNESPAWSPDGLMIAFSSLRGGDVGIYVMDARGEAFGVSEVGQPQGWNAFPSWSPDGEKIAFTSDWRAFDFVYDIYAANASGAGITPLLTGDLFTGVYFFQPAWAPDGAMIAAVACGWGWTTCDPDSTLVIVNADGSGLRRVAEVSGYARPAWSPDGTAIAYSSRTCAGCSTSLYYISPNGSFTGLIVADGSSPSWRR
jgi:dipeptidyl aminopeptidase/acylaminoacyl peptidase